MKKNILKVIIMLIFVTSLTGCTKILKDENGKAIKNEITGQSLTENILCRPEDSKTIEKYKNSNIKIENFPKCSDLSITHGEYEGVWTSIFVKPLAWLIIKIGLIVKSYGLAIILITLLIRILVIPLTAKTALQSENLKKAKPELDKLEKKYANKKDQQSLMLKNQEMMLIYKKYNINPISGCLFAFIQIPLFFAFYESINRLPAVFEENFIGFQLGTNPMTAIGNGQIYYIIFMLLIVASTYFSFKMNGTTSMSSDQEKQMKMITNIMIVFIAIASFTLPSAIAVYWITNSSFTIGQNLFLKRKRKDVK